MVVEVQPKLEDWPIAPEKPKLVQWRKRLRKARGRGEFSAEDHALICDYATCLVGEKHGFSDDGAYDMTEREEDIGLDACDAIYLHDFDALERYIEELEIM